MITAPFDFAVEDYPLGPETLYNVGGPAKVALFPGNGDEVYAAYTWMKGQQLPTLVLGGGSNVLIADEGFPGIVLFSNRLDRVEDLGAARYRVEGGVVLDRLVQEVMLKHNYTGAGGLTGIPGSVGGAIYMNAGTVNGSICQLLESVDLVSDNGKETVSLSESLFSYRGQRFCPPGSLIVSGTFQFAPAQEDQRAIYEHYIQRRRVTQPQGRCCGSVFKNPSEDHAGRLIEACGLKGVRKGDAIISDIHANFVMNEGSASCEDILWLIDLAKERVKEKFGVLLEEEVRVIRAC